MKNTIALTIVLGLTVAFGAGCSSQKPAANANQAIEESKTKGTVQQQADYLVGQARMFLDQKNYDQAVATANHILNNLDANSQAAKDVLTKAANDMKAGAQNAVNDLKNKFGNVGK